MRIHTVNFGDLDVSEDAIITFSDGLPGFPRLRRFVILETDDIKPFQYLQALPEKNAPLIALYLINPFLIEPDYEFRITDSDMDAVKCADSKELTAYAVVTIPADPEASTINLMAPIVVNKKDRLGRQVILHDSDYSVRHPLIRGAEAETGNPDTDNNAKNPKAEND